MGKKGYFRRFSHWTRGGGDGYSIALNGNKRVHAQLLLRAFVLCCRIQFQYG
jgi:hypothetical protein